MLTWLADERPAHGPVGDQGLRPTCLAWATTAAHEHQRGLGPLSVEYLHWASGNHQPGRGRIPAIAAALDAEGQPIWDGWAYDQSEDEGAATYGPPPGGGELHFADVRFCSLTVDSLEAELANGICPVIGLRVTDAFLMAAGGVVLDDGPGVDGHAVTAVGLAQVQGRPGPAGVAPGSRFVCVRNSWGPTWGVNGYALVLESALIACGLVAFAVEQR